jgi:hypothetical protein
MSLSFTEHPASVGESYLEHLVFASRFGCHMIAGGVACCIHGVLPFLFTSTGSRIVLNLHALLIRKRSSRICRSRASLPGETLADRLSPPFK